MNYKVWVPILFFASILFYSCTDDEDSEGIEGISSIAGYISLPGQEFALSGGLIEYKSYKDESLGTYHEFKMADIPVYARRDTIRTYVSSQEKVTLIFSVNSYSSKEAISGTYLFTSLSSESTTFPFGGALFNPQVWLSKSSPSKSLSYRLGILGGEVLITGEYPEFEIEGELKLENNQVSTFYAKGTFVTQENFFSFNDSF